MHEGENLIPNGDEIKVNEYNREIYCHKIGTKIVGNSTWKYGSKFVRGYIHQKKSKWSSSRKKSLMSEN